MRAFGFLREFEVQNPSLDPLLFATESLHRLWRMALAPERPAGLRAFYASSAQAKEYENIWKDQVCDGA
jgi:hypothetical protein